MSSTLLCSRFEKREVSLEAFAAQMASEPAVFADSPSSESTKKIEELTSDLQKAEARCQSLQGSLDLALDEKGKAAALLKSERKSNLTLKAQVSELENLLSNCRAGWRAPMKRAADAAIEAYLKLSGDQLIRGFWSCETVLCKKILSKYEDAYMEWFTDYTQIPEVELPLDVVEDPLPKVAELDFDALDRDPVEALIEKVTTADSSGVTSAAEASAGIQASKKPAEASAAVDP